MRQPIKIMLGILLTLSIFAIGSIDPGQAIANSGSGSSGSDDDLDLDDDDHSDGGDDSSGDDSGSGDGGDDDNSGSSSDGDGDSSHDGDDDDSERSANSGSSSSSGTSNGQEDSSGSGSGTDATTDNSGKGNRGEERVARAEDRLDVEKNEDGDLVRTGEVVHMSKYADISTRVAKRGLRIIEAFQLPSLGMKGLRIAVPNKRSGASVLAELRAVDPQGISTYNHVYNPARGGATLASAPVAGTPPPAKRANLLIGLVDAGVDTKHAMLRNVRISAQTFGAGPGAPENHGTAVASRIAGAAPGAHILAANVFSLMENGQETATADAIVRGLDWLSQLKIPVINLSLNGPANPMLEAMTARLTGTGHILVAAVGNEGPHAAPQYPAAYKNVVGVTAVDSQDRVYLYANQGDYVDFAAGGVDTAVATPSGDVEKASGTSYAAPVVAVALARRIDHPDVELAQRASQSLKNSARDLGAPGRDPIYGFGLIENDR